MTRAKKVRATKVRQHGVAQKQTKAGKPFNGANLVAQKETSAKKTARKAAAGRKKAAA